MDIQTEGALSSTETATMEAGDRSASLPPRVEAVETGDRHGPIALRLPMWSGPELP